MVSALENRVVGGLTPDLGDRRLLDVGCGVGRRLLDGARRSTWAAGMDLVPEMLFEARRLDDARPLVAADVRCLPFADESFDVLWCRLVLGHVESLDRPYAELARVSRPSAQLIVSDFHCSAAAAGHKRTFRHASGEVIEVEHHVHPRERHENVARAHGWRCASVIEAPAGRPERAFYERAGRLHQLEAEATLPLVLVMKFER